MLKKCNILLILLLLVLIGTGIFAVSSFFTTPADTKNTSETFSDDIFALKMEIGAADIHILSGTQFRLETNNPHIAAQEKRGILTIREKPHISDLDNSTLTLYLPQQLLLEDAEISSGAGRLELEELRCRELDLELGAGMVEIHHLTVEKSADIKGGAGQIVIHNGSFHNLELDMGLGRAEIFATLTGATELSAGIGELVLTVPESPENYTVTARSGIGEMKINGQPVFESDTFGTGPKLLKLEGGIGSVSVYFEPQ